MTATRFDFDDASVVVVVGSGAGGATLANELCQRQKKVVCIEAGPRLSVGDYHNDEFFAYRQMTWLDKRKATGEWSVAKSSPNMPAYTVKAVGGTTNHWGALAFRMQPHELRARDIYGAVAGADVTNWPVTATELEPYWSLAEQKMGVTGTHGIPWLPETNNYKVIAYGAHKAGYTRVANDRHAINSQPRDNRAACLQLGFCGQGCKSGAKWATGYTEIPKAEATGYLDLRPNCMVLRVLHDARRRVTGVIYRDADGHEQHQHAAVVVIAGNAIETPRLLLNSASGAFPQGLANSSDWVGRGYMRHLNGSAWGLFSSPVHMNHGVAMGGTIYDESALDTGRGFVGGYLLQAAQVGIPFLAGVIAPQGWGRAFTQFIDGYDHLAGIWLNGEDLPRAGNRVTVDANERDDHGLPFAAVHVDDHPNDIALRAHFRTRAETVLRAAGATAVLHGATLPASHNMGTCRMSANPMEGVTNPYGQTHDVANLFIADGSVFPTSSAENPTLTIVALAIRQAEHIHRLARTGHSRPRSHA